jgi:hypothetical protein
VYFTSHVQQGSPSATLAAVARQLLAKEAKVQPTDVSIAAVGTCLTKKDEQLADVAIAVRELTGINWTDSNQWSSTSHSKSHHTSLSDSLVRAAALAAANQSQSGKQLKQQPFRNYGIITQKVVAIQ